MKQIKIDGVEQMKLEFGTKTIFKSGKEKYYFFDTLKAGGNTKAYDQFKKYRFGVGDVVSAEVAEEQKSFKDKKTGKDVSYTDRKIMYFQEDNNLPAVEVAPKEPKKFGLDEVWTAIRQLQTAQEGIYKRLNALETPKEATEDKGDDDLPPF